MKLFIVLALAVIGAIAAPTDDDTDVAAEVTEALKEILDALPDPLVDEHNIKSFVDLGFETFDITFNDLVLSGIKSMDITTMDYDATTGRLDYELTFGEIDLLLDIDLILAGTLDADNHLVINVALNNLKLAGFAVVDTSSNPHRVTDFDLLITLESSKGEMKGLLNDDVLSEKLTNILNTELAAIFNTITEQLEPAISPIVKYIINIIISVTS